MISHEQGKCIQRTFGEIRDAEAFAMSFYSILFARAPEVRNLFPVDLTEQSRKLAVMLSVVASCVDHPARLSTFRQLGARHRKYGAVHEHFSIVEEALLDTLACELRDSFLDADRNAWKCLLDRVCTEMSLGMEAAALP